MKEAIRTIISQLVASLPPGILTDSKFFNLYQSKGYHITPVHFYEAIPDTADLPDELWEKPSQLVGINLNIADQILLLESFQAFIQEFLQIPNTPPSSPCEYTRTLIDYPQVDAHILYSMIRKYQPKRIIEIGSGVSSLLSVTALKKNIEINGNHGTITAIEPYPKEYLEKCLVDGNKLIKNKVEEIPLAEFEQLEENDILFIDSSHTVKINNDVIYEVLEILPRLKKGVLIHIHDIFLPLPYSKEMVKDRHIFWTEQYLVQAFLAFNDFFEVIWSAAALKFYEPEKLKSSFPDIFTENPDFIPGALWIKKCR
jgi:predicted O-methyltransferase YrrM